MITRLIDLILFPMTLNSFVHQTPKALIWQKFNDLMSDIKQVS